MDERRPDRRAVLLVDDHPVLADLVARALTGAGHTVARCGNLVAAREALEAAAVDVLVVEEHLAGGSGRQLFAPARAAGVAAIVATSARGCPQEQVALRRAGADRVVDKPVPASRIVELVNGLMVGVPAQLPRRMDKKIAQAR